MHLSASAPAKQALINRFLKFGDEIVRILSQI